MIEEVKRDCESRTSKYTNVFQCIKFASRNCLFLCLKDNCNNFFAHLKDLLNAQVVLHWKDGTVTSPLHVHNVRFYFGVQLDYPSFSTRNEQDQEEITRICETIREKVRAGKPFKLMITLELDKFPKDKQMKSIDITQGIQKIESMGWQVFGDWTKDEAELIYYVIEVDPSIGGGYLLPSAEKKLKDKLAEEWKDLLNEYERTIQWTAGAARGQAFVNKAYQGLMDFVEQNPEYRRRLPTKRVIKQLGPVGYEGLSVFAQYLR